jgi:hypothetical protein
MDFREPSEDIAKPLGGAARDAALVAVEALIFFDQEFDKSMMNTIAVINKESLAQLYINTAYAQNRRIQSCLKEVIIFRAILWFSHAKSRPKSFTSLLLPLSSTLSSVSLFWN